MTSLTIRHSPAEGTLLLHTSRGDGTNQVLKGLTGLRWRWGRDLGCWYLQGSRDRLADRARIERTAAALRANGHDVEIEYTAERRSVAEREADRADRVQTRVERRRERAERLTVAGEAGWDAARELASHIPLGQPILVDHHSAGRHRRDLARIDRMEDRAIDQLRAAEEAAGRAAASAANQRHRLSGPATQRRIETLEAEERRVQRCRDGYERTVFVHNGVRHTESHPPAEGAYRERLEEQLRDIGEELAHWRAHLETLEAADGYRVWSREDFRKGDYVAFRFGWAKVLRVNAKTLTVPHLEPRLAAAGGTWKVPYDQVRDRRPANDPPAVLVENEHAAGTDGRPHG